MRVGVAAQRHPRLAPDGVEHARAPAAGQPRARLAVPRLERVGERVAARRRAHHLPQLAHERDALRDRSGVADVDSDAPAPEGLHVLAQVLLHVGKDEIGAERTDELEVGVLLAPHACLARHPLRGLSAVDGAAGHRVPDAEREEDLGEAGHERDDPAGRH